jgi:hypothetical protein
MRTTLADKRRDRTTIDRLEMPNIEWKAVNFVLLKNVGAETWVPMDTAKGRQLNLYAQ